MGDPNLVLLYEVQLGALNLSIPICFFQAE
jgi:hypothetical protein